MAVSSALLSVAEFARLAQPVGGIRQELRHGQVVELPPVKMIHTRIQKRLVSLLEGALNGSFYGADKEFPFRPLPEHEVWIADVAVYSLTQVEKTGDDDYFEGVPSVVIEVLSPSNTASEMLDREAICLQNGGHEFWIVDPQRTNVKVIHAGGASQILSTGSFIESAQLIKAIAVSDIFASL